jgi:RHS repeat-associated protein
MLAHYPAGANAQERLVSPAITVEQPGLLYITLYNRSNSANFVYFDDLTVTQAHSRVVVGSDFYPFGLVMDGTEITDEAYRYGYQGQFSEKDLTTGWNEFELRMYDARFGRWLSPDPYGQFASPYVGMGNNPIMSVDPTGGCVPPCGVSAANMAWAEAYAITATRLFTDARWAMVGLNMVGQTLTMAGPSFNPNLKWKETPTSINPPRVEPMPSRYNFDAEWSPQRTVDPRGDDWLAHRVSMKPDHEWAGNFAMTIATGGGAVEYVAGKAIYGLAAARVLGSRKILEGVYSISTTGGSYIGQSKNVLQRVTSHFSKGGKLSTYTPVSKQFYSMPGSSKLEREVYEQYLIFKNNPTLNIRNPMGGRIEAYKKMIHGVIRKYNLPL